MTLLIREQFVNTCSAEMALFFRERVPKNISEMVKLAGQYLEAHGMSLQERQKETKKPSGHHQKSKDPSKTEQKEADKNEGISKDTWLRTVDKPKTSSRRSPHRKQQVQLR